MEARRIARQVIAFTPRGREVHTDHHYDGMKL